jgi:hypothetical protein
MLKCTQVFSKVYVTFVFDFRGKQIVSTNSFAIPEMNFDDNHSGDSRPGKYGAMNRYDQTSSHFLILLPALQN